MSEKFTLCEASSVSLYHSLIIYQLQYVIETDQLARIFSIFPNLHFFSLCYFLKIYAWVAVYLNFGQLFLFLCGIVESALVALLLPLLKNLSCNNY